MKLPPLNFYKSPNKPTIFFFFFILKKPCISTCQNHSSTHSLSLSPPQSPSTPIHKIRSILESPFQPTHQPLPITFKTDFLPPEPLHPRVNQPRQTRSQRSENKRPTSVSLVRELPPPNRVEIGIGYRTNREHGHRVTTIEKESPDRNEATRIERDPVSMDAHFWHEGVRYRRGSEKQGVVEGCGLVAGSRDIGINAV